jgi:hypothetical protein
MRYGWCALFVACAAASAFQLGNAPPADADRRADVYAIYSLLLTNPQTSHGPDDNEIYLIGGTTVPGTPRNPCVHAPSEEAARFAEVMADYERRKDVPAVLEPAFHIAKPFRLLNGDEVNEFFARQLTIATPAQRPPKVTDLFRLTDVYFDRNRTLALTAISTWCGSLCGMYQWKVLEKTADGQWKEKPWVGCFAVAQTDRGQTRPTALLR